MCGSPGFHFVFPCLTLSIHVPVGRHCLIHYICSTLSSWFVACLPPSLMWLPREAVAADGAQLTWSGRGRAGSMIDGTAPPSVGCVWGGVDGLATRGLANGSVVASQTGCCEYDQLSYILHSIWYNIFVIYYILSLKYEYFSQRVVGGD
jgi:hypothetical protein